MEPQVRIVALPADLCEKVEARLVGERFSALEEVISFVLAELARDDAAQLDAAEEQIIEQRLRDLGYI